MKTKIYIIAALLVSYSGSLYAQKNNKDSVVNRSVTVERDFQPVIQDVGKIITTPKEIEPEVEKTTPSYANFTSPLSVNYSIHPLDPEILKHKPNDPLKGYLRLGIGFPMNTLGDFMYPVIKNDNNRLDFSIHHLGAFGDKKHSKTSAGLQYDHLFDNFSIIAGLGATHDYFNYYGRMYGTESPFLMYDVAALDANYTTSPNTTVSLYELSAYPQNETHWRINTLVGIKSSPISEGLKYYADLQYNVFQSVKEDMNENHLKLSAQFEVPFDDNKLGMDVEINNLQYSVYHLNRFNFPETYSVLKFNPYYKMSGDFGFVKLGVKTGISGHGQTFTPSPDVDAQWNAVPEYLAIYGGVTGDLQINTMSYMYDENRYLSAPLRLNDLYTPIDAYAGIKLKPAYNFLFDIFTNYKIIKDQYFFVNKQYDKADALSVLPSNINTSIYHNRFDTINANASQLTLGLRANYNYKEMVNVYFKGAYHFWDVSGQQYAWQKPTWDADFGASVKVWNDILLNTQVFFQDGRYAKLGDKAVKMTSVLDINLGGSYIYSKNFTFFLKANNLLNRKYDIYYGYEVQGINAMAGVIISF